MPTLTRWFIKSALLYFVAALLVGVLLAGQRVLDFLAPIEGLVPVYFHLFMVGWLTQLIFGVSYWMFPRRSRDEPRGSEGLGWAAFAALNAGLLLRALAEPIYGVRADPMWGWALVLSAGLQWAAGLAYVAGIWGRVKER